MNMANNNPIKLVDTGTYPVFTIPKKYASKTITISTTTSLAKDGWQLDLIHAMTFDKNPVDFDPTPDVDKAVLGTGKKIDGKKFALASIVTRIRNGATGKPPKATYSIRFEAGDEVVDQEFSLTSDEANSTTFYTRVTFKLEQ